MVPKQEKRKWLPVKLLHTTMDQDAWEVQWYNTHDQGDMLTARYYLAWEKPNGQEIYCANAKTGYKPLQWCVYKGRFITPAFKFQSNRLPPAIRALIRAHSVSKPMSKSKIWWFDGGTTPSESKVSTERFRWMRKKCPWLCGESWNTIHKNLQFGGAKQNCECQSRLPNGRLLGDILWRDHRLATDGST